MWYGQIAEQIEQQLMATLKPFRENHDLCVDCNGSLLNQTAVGGFNEDEYKTAIEDFKQSLQTHDDVRSIILILLYIPVFSVAFVGNCLVLLVVLLNRTMRNITNLLLLNLAVADLSVSLVCVPIAVGQSVYRAWIYGEFMCKFTNFLQGTAVTASVFTICLLSVDRYLAIKKPMLFRRIRSPTIAMKLISVVWILSILTMIPLFIYRKVDEIELLHTTSLIFCLEEWFPRFHRLVYDLSICVVVYVCPGVAILISYIMIGKKLWSEDVNLHRAESETSKGIARHVLSTRKRIAKMLIVLAILFSVCWLPYHIISIYLDIQQKDVEHAVSALPFAILLGHTNSAINPILYFYASRGFRRCVARFLQCKKYGTSAESPLHMVVKYTPPNGTAPTDGSKNPLVRILSSSTVGSRSRSRSTRSTRSNRSSGSFRFSRSTNTSLRSSRSSRSSGSLRRHEATKPLSKLNESEKQPKAVPQIHVAEVTNGDAGDAAQTLIDKDAALKHRRDIFNCTLSIPTTINEESSRSRSTSPCPFRHELPSAIWEEVPNLSPSPSPNPSSSPSPSPSPNPSSSDSPCPILAPIPLPGDAVSTNNSPNTSSFFVPISSIEHGSLPGTIQDTLSV